MTPDFRISQGDTTLIQATLTDGDGAAVNLTGATVTFRFQCAAAGVAVEVAALILDAGAGQVAYQMTPTASATPGVYQAQWSATFNDGSVRTFPTSSISNDETNGRYIVFEIVPTVPMNPEAGITLISDTFEGLRVILGDRSAQFRKYNDDTLSATVRTVLRMGGLQGYRVAPNQRGITPAIVKPRDFGILLYKAAKLIVLPDAGEYAYKTRAISERFGDQKIFVFELQNQLYDLENDGGVFRTWQSFYGWVNSLTGMNVWSLMTDMKQRAPVATVIIGRAGIQVNTT